MLRLVTVFLLLASAPLLVSGCAKPAPEFSVYTKPEVNFTAFKTYTWQEVRPETAIMQAQDDIAHRLIVQTVEEELASDGLKKNDRGDLTVVYRVTVSPQKGFWQTFFGAESVTPGTYNQRSAEAQASASGEHKLHQGVLVIDLLDRKGVLVWSGRASVVYSKSQPGEAVLAVRKIMEAYPPE